jgi:hypothetical protein
VGPDGQQLVDEAGKRRYGKVVSFDGAEARSRGNDMVIATVADGGIAAGSAAPRIVPEARLRHDEAPSC